jgi:hypothetical protein
MAAEFTNYEIVSIKGRVYSRAMLLSTASRMPLYKALSIKRSELAAILDDGAWMRPHRGEIPARVCDDAIFEAVRRRG